MNNAFHEAHKVLSYDKFKKRFWDSVALRYISEKKAADILEPFGLTPAEFLAARAKYIRAICKELDKRIAAMPKTAGEIAVAQAQALQERQTA